MGHFPPSTTPTCPAPCVPLGSPHPTQHKASQSSYSKYASFLIVLMFHWTIGLSFVISRGEINRKVIAPLFCRWAESRGRRCPPSRKQRQGHHHSWIWHVLCLNGARFSIPGYEGPAALLNWSLGQNVLCHRQSWKLNCIPTVPDVGGPAYNFLPLCLPERMDRVLYNLSTYSKYQSQLGVHRSPKK